MKSFILSLTFAAIVLSHFPTQDSVKADRVSVLQSITTAEYLAIAADCMIEEGYDESDMHEALSDAIRAAK